MGGSVVEFSPVGITQLLIAWSNGDETARDRLMPLVYDELRRLASHQLKRERSDHLLQTTALVHEAYLRMVDFQGVDWKNRAHFFGLAAHLMRQILVDYARARDASKRGSGTIQISMAETPEVLDLKNFELLALNDALESLAQLSPRQSQIVELRFFGGLNTDEISEVLGVSPRTVHGDWSVARAWLANEIRRTSP